MAINLDNKLQTVKEFIVGGKKRNVVYDDKFMAAIAEADIRIGKNLEKYIDPDEETIEEFNKKTAVQQLEIYSDLQAKVKNDLVNTLDSAFGQGAGEELYAYFNHSTNSLYAIVEALNEYSDVVKQEQKSGKSKVKNYYEKKNRKK